MPRSPLLAAIALLLLVTPQFAPGVEPAVADDGLHIVRDDDSGETEIIVPSRDGCVEWHDVLRGMTRAARLDDEALPVEAVGEPLDLTRRSTRLTLRTLSAAIPDVSFRIVEHPESGEPALLIRLDRGDAREKLRRVKAWLRERYGEAGEYGLTFDEDWQDRPARRPLVVLVHGYNSGPESLCELHDEIAARDWPVATFAYANDGPLRDAAELLASELKAFRKEHPQRKVTIVAHSMGGLVARAAIELPGFDPGNVTQVILVCTPNHGTQWAEFPCGMDCWEHLVSLRDDSPENVLRAALGDGLDEAGSDLKPGSKFLRELNARPLNPRFRYALILGTDGPLTAAELGLLRQRADRALDESRAAALFRPRLDGFFADFNEPVTGRGDGAVSVERGRLEGVDDVLLLPVRHLDLTREFRDPRQLQLRDAILNRL
jgi:pimeloyl-ACP methyl ester carboxylesterase